MGEPVLRAVGVTKDYGSGAAATRALDGVDLTIERGRFISVMGPSGSGKSTLLHLLAGLDRPTTGEVWFDGRLLSAMSDGERTALRRSAMALVFQHFNLIPVLTAAENVALPLVIAKVSASERRARVAEALSLVAISDRAAHLPADIAGGEQQRVAVARALVARPSVLFADEPTGSLDTETGAEILGVIRAAQRELGQTIVLVTHDARVAATGDEVIRLRDGAVVEHHPVRRRRGSARRQLEEALDEEPCSV